MVYVDHSHVHLQRNAQLYTLIRDLRIGLMEFEYLKGLETFESVQNYIQTQ